MTDEYPETLSFLARRQRLRRHAKSFVLTAALSLGGASAYDTYLTIRCTELDRHTRLLCVSLFGASVAALLFYCLWWYDRSELHRCKRRVILGVSRISPSEYNLSANGSGVGIPATIPQNPDHSPEFLYLPSEMERHHILVAGDTGSGKTALFLWLLSQIVHRRDDLAVIYDPSLEFWRHLGDPLQGDVLLHPLAANCPYWDIADEIQTEADADSLARSFLPTEGNGNARFWNDTAREVLAALFVRMRESDATAADLVAWLSDADMVSQIVKGTPAALFIDENATQQRIGVLASMNRIATSLKYLPPNLGRPRFSFREWNQLRRGYVFVGCSGPKDQDALLPLRSAWVDRACYTLMEAIHAPPSWLFIDELPTLAKQESLKKALTQGRKYNLRCVVGFQGRSQIQHIYEDAEALMSSPQTKIVLRTSDGIAAKALAEAIGKPLFEKDTESYTHQAFGKASDTLSLTTKQWTDYAVQPIELQQLPPRQGFVRTGPYLVPISFPYPDLPMPNPPPDVEDSRQIGADDREQRIRDFVKEKLDRLTA